MEGVLKPVLVYSCDGLARPGKLWALWPNAAAAAGVVQVNRHARKIGEPQIRWVKLEAKRKQAERFHGNTVPGPVLIANRDGRLQCYEQVPWEGCWVGR